jgi:hypothetical protein
MAQGLKILTNQSLQFMLLFSLGFQASGCALVGSLLS